MGNRTRSRLSLHLFKRSGPGSLEEVIGSGLQKKKGDQESLAFHSIGEKNFMKISALEEGRIGREIKGGQQFIRRSDKTEERRIQGNKRGKGSWALKKLKGRISRVLEESVKVNSGSLKCRFRKSCPEGHQETGGRRSPARNS